MRLQSIEFARRETQITRFALNACFIAFMEAIEPSDVVMTGQALRSSMDRYESALRKFCYEVNKAGHTEQP